MAKNYVQDGDALAWLNNTGAAVAVNTPVVFGLWCMAIALVNIAIGTFGTVQLKGVFGIPKGSTTFAQGAGVWWDTVNQIALPSPILNSYFIGYAALSALSTESTVAVGLEEFTNEPSRVLTLAATGAQTLGAGDFMSGKANIFCPNTAAQTVNLPACSSVPIGAMLSIKKTTTATPDVAVTIAAHSPDSITGASSLATQNASINLVNTGTGWLQL
jgi:predicted RecA/RadA family phage recombinase